MGLLMATISFLNVSKDRVMVSQYTLNVLKDVMIASNVTSLMITSTARTPREQARGDVQQPGKVWRRTSKEALR